MENRVKYPKDELILKSKLDELFSLWYQEATKKIFIKKYSAEDIVFDGFYPFYSHQRKKILFIGREALGISGYNYIEVLYDAYKKNYIGGRHINQYKFHYLMFYLAYGIIHGLPEWTSIPEASELTKSFATKNGISFAFMNLSKLSNESDNWQADWRLIDCFTNAFKHSSINYFNREIEILNPDIIITMNFEDRLKILGSIDVIQNGNDASCYYLCTSNSKKLLIDLFHFSAPTKRGKEHYYEPVKKLIYEQIKDIA